MLTVCYTTRRREQGKKVRINLKGKNGIDAITEPVFVNVYGAHPYGTGPPGWESIPGLLKRFTNTGPGLFVADPDSSKT
jgi:hypothetical protein